jgi:ring-1,2-phenylacetyl-CoA epoxidase subunit PaaC
VSALTTAPALARYALGLGDDALVLAQRCGEWLTRAPQLEEDVALANIGLDLLGQARALLSHAGEVEGAGRDEDDLAYLRGERELLNVQLVELDNGDFAVSMARLLVFSSYQLELYRALSGSTDAVLAGVAAKAVKEVDYHRDHATSWVLRLGDGTDESHQRMQAGLERVWPYVEELFTSSDRHGVWPDPALVRSGAAVDPVALRPAALAHVESVVARATLTRPEPRFTARGGRSGVHTDALPTLLAELQHLHRSHPGASW